MSLNPFSAFRWEWNINTVIVLFGFGAGLVAWGGQWQQLQDTRIRSQANEVLINEVQERVAELQWRSQTLATTAEANTRQLNTMQSGYQDLAADIRVTKEIVTRIETRLDRGGVEP